MREHKKLKGARKGPRRPECIFHGQPWDASSLMYLCDACRPGAELALMGLREKVQLGLINPDDTSNQETAAWRILEYICTGREF